MTKLQKILLFLGLGTLVGGGVWYALKSKKKQVNEVKNSQIENQNSQIENNNVDLPIENVLTPALLDYQNDEVGTQYQLDFYEPETNTNRQPIGFEILRFHNVKNGNWNAHGEIVNKVDFLGVKSIRTIWQNDKESVLNFFENAENKNQYIQNNNLLDSATPDYPMLVRAKNGKLYAVPVIEYGFGNYSKRELLKRV